jgi:Reverse transcriptase (RNA-dependent DNA polymerase)
MNWTLLDKVWAMLTDAGLPESYWYNALSYAAYAHNISPTHALNNIMPEEAWSGNKPDISRLRVFGCQVFVHIPDKLRSKLGAKSLICTFLSYAQHCKVYCLVHHPSGRFLESCNVVFDEGGPESCYECTVLEHNSTDNSPTPPDPSSSSTPSTSPSQLTKPADPSPDSEPPAPPACLKRTTHMPIRDNNPQYSITSYSPQSNTAEHTSVVQADTASDLWTYAEVMSCLDTAQWEAACKDKMHSFESMGIYEIALCPKDCKVVGSKWVFQIKWGPDGSIQKYKVCIVTQGFTQVEGLDYNQTFAPVAKFNSFRAVLAITAKHNWDIHQMDVKAAYLNGRLEEEIFMELLPSFNVPEGMVLKLIKVVYSTKQGG